RLSPQTNERTRCRNDAGYLPKQETSIAAVNPVDVISVDVGQTSKLDIGMCYMVMQMDDTMMTLKPKTRHKALSLCVKLAAFGFPSHYTVSSICITRILHILFTMMADITHSVDAKPEGLAHRYDWNFNDEKMEDNVDNLLDLALKIMLDPQPRRDSSSCKGSFRSSSQTSKLLLVNCDHAISRRNMNSLYACFCKGKRNFDMEMDSASS
ncbi:hypothetical protein Tco_0638352, partial [Tanacetum coccineum]